MLAGSRIAVNVRRGLGPHGAAEETGAFAPVSSRPAIGLAEAEEGAVLPAVVARQHELAAGAGPFLEGLPRIGEDPARVDGQTRAARRPRVDGELSGRDGLALARDPQ